MDLRGNFATEPVEEQTGINRRTFRRYRARYNVTVDQRKNNEKRDS
ncbi:TPA: resolvase [Enterococcus faecium]|nr:resolvase [Enterococcus faecalis]QMX45252.1 resolvase [Enterococcus faecium]HBH6687928.1 resolvase [Enterococcus faecium]HBK5020874.1 resolvase [Enterococcus faecium]HBK5395325.1 resolvase [Enterococcus faecium]